MRRTKIVCTLGPSSNDAETIGRLIDAGMNVARLNFSHGSHEDHRRVFETLRRVAADKDSNIAILMDLQGPKIRTGRLRDGEPVELRNSAKIVITTQDIEGNASRISTTYENLPHDVPKDSRILIADGSMELAVENVKDTEVYCRVVRGGMLGQHKGMNLPGVAVSAPSMTEKDIEDLTFGLELGVDYVALSFVRSAEDVRGLKTRIAEADKTTPVIAKIERPEALTCFDEIMDEVDGIMVARGDLGVEVELHRVPQIQKSLIRMCVDRGIPVITATQMLESMISSPRPTRAEANDVANAIYDGTDAVMLSGETANGKYPVEAVQVMATIAESADEALATSPDRPAQGRFSSGKREASFKDAIGQAVVRMTQVTDLRHIVVLTQSGYSAETIARYRPRIPITAITLSEETRRLCALIWGVDAVQSAVVESMDDMIHVIDRIVLEKNLAQQGDPIVTVAGTPLGVGGRTNLLHLHRVGENESRAVQA